jgi:hypothetical protein
MKPPKGGFYCRRRPDVALLLYVIAALAAAEAVLALATFHHY